MGDRDQAESTGQGVWLVTVAAPKEVRAVLDGLGCPDPVPEPWRPIPCAGCEVLRTGVGKWAAAGAVGRWFDPARHAGVLSVGIAGALPGAWIEIGTTVLADPSVLADDGVLTPKGFVGLPEMGFGADAEPITADHATRTAVLPLIDVAGPVATVSLCSGMDAWAGETARRTDALAEAMEGAAAGLAARRIDPDARFAEVRVISNTTGDRDRQQWDLDAGLTGLRDLIGPLIRALNV